MWLHEFEWIARLLLSHTAYKYYKHIVSQNRAEEFALLFSANFMNKSIAELL